MAGRGDAHEAVQAELQGERLSSLARATARLEAALDDLSRAEAALAAGATPARRDAREAALAEAGERLWYVIIQREALGLRRHDVLYDVIRVPAAVRGRMGPRRRG
jgi:hypothetical protein